MGAGQSQPALIAAAARGDLRAVKTLLPRPAEVNGAEQCGWRALHAAAFENHHDVCLELLRQGAEVDAKDQNGCTPLHMAALGGHLEVVELLCSRHADVKAADAVNRWMPLHKAASHGHHAVVTELLSHNVDVNTIADGCVTALHLAAGGQHEACVATLLDQGAKCDGITHEGMTPLHIAAGHGYLSICQRLLDSGASTAAQTRQGDTPADVARKMGKREVAAMLEHAARLGHASPAQTQYEDARDLPPARGRVGDWGQPSASVQGDDPDSLQDTSSSASGQPPQGGPAGSAAQAQQELARPGPPQFREEQLAQSTSYWSPQHVLGHGLHGQTFFAELDGKPCAVKRLPAGFLQLILPLATALAGLQHPCINTLLGWGSSASHAFLVSSLSPHGSLLDSLEGRPLPAPLGSPRYRHVLATWQQRVQAAACTATGLHHLHKDGRVAHGSLCPANILVYGADEYRLADCGLEPCVPLQAASPYRPSREGASKGSDVYALGVVLLQLLTCRAPTGLADFARKCLNRPDAVQRLLDTSFNVEWPAEQAIDVAHLGVRCTAEQHSERPGLQETLEELLRLKG